MLKAGFLLSLLILLNGFACDTQKQDDKLRSLEAEVKQLKAEVADLKQKQKATPEHHYELRNVGFRTWRFDPATGETCIQLTSDDDWKRKDTKSQSCGCSDAMEHWTQMPTDTDQQQERAQRYYKAVVERACGY